MASTVDPTASPEVEAAIGRVLAAERLARDAVAACGRQAERLLEEARGREKAIAERAARRIAAIRAAIAKKLAARLAALEDSRRRPEPEAVIDAAARARLAVAVGRLADELTGMRR